MIFSAGDGLDYAYPAIHFLKENVTKNIYYDPSWLGGAKVEGVWASPWFLSLPLLFGLSTPSLLFLCFFVPQVLLAFASLRFLGSLGAGTSDFRPVNVLKKISWIFLFAFPPFLGWSFLEGRFFYPSLFALAVCALFASICRRQLSLFSALVLVATMVSAAQSVSYQQFISAAYVSLPFLVILAWKLKPGKFELAIFFTLGAAAALWCLRQQLEMLAHFMGADASRSEKGAQIVFSFVVANWRDWLASVFWHRELLTPPRPMIEIAETNIASGPLLMFLLAGWSSRRWRSLGWAALVLFAVLMAFASNVFPVPSLLFFLAPPLEYFRVPLRTIFPLLYCALPIALFFLEEARMPGTAKKSRAAGWIVLLSLAVYFSPAPIREGMVWILVVALVWKKAAKKFGSEVFLFPLAMASLLAFGGRLAITHDLRETDRNAQALREKILKEAPELKNPLVRATLDFQDKKFHANTAHVLGISSLDGYWQPLKSFNSIASDAYRVPTNPLALNFRIPNSEPASEKLYELYNVKYRLHLDADGTLRVKPVDSKGKSAWLLQGGADLPCGDGQVKMLRILDAHFSLEAEVRNAGGCRIVFASNFAENILATNEQGETLPTRPALGGLLAVQLPEHVDRVSLRAVSSAPAWARFSQILGGTLFFLAIALWRLRHPRRLHHRAV